MDNQLYPMVANPGTVFRQGKITSVDMYNSILRLISNSDDWNTEYLARVIAFQDKYEDEDTSRPENYILLAKDLGDPYIQGILRLTEK